MVQIIEERREPTLSEKFGRAFTGASREAAQKIPELLMGMNQRKQQQNAFSELGLPSSLSSLPEELQKIVVSQSIKNQGDPKQNSYLSGLETIQRMRQLKETGHLGPKISQLGFLGFLNPNVRRDRSEYEQLGKSLISLASTIPIRNQKEFDVLSRRLYDPTQTDADIEGILNAMERIIHGSMGQSHTSMIKEHMTEPSVDHKAARPKLTSFYR